MIASRIADARARLKAKGRRIAGAVPYGYDGDPGTKQLVVNPNEARAIKWMFGTAAEGKLPLAIAAEANARGWLTKTGALRQPGCGVCNREGCPGEALKENGSRR